MDEEGWKALPQFTSGPGSHTQSSELLDLGGDYGIGFGAALTPSPRALSPVQNAVPTPPNSGFEQQPQRRKVIFWEMIFHFLENRV